MRALLLAGLTVGLAASAAAQPLPRPDSSASAPSGGTWTVETLPVTVTAARLPLAPADAPARVTVLGPDAIDATAATSVADLLDARAPVLVRRYGPSGLATLSVRGSGAAQTLILLDGLPLASPALGVVDLSLVPASLVASAEVLSGAASGLWGSSAMGGVVALRSGTASGLRAAVEAGPWGARQASASGAARVGGATAFAAADVASATDDYAVRERTRLGWDSRHASVVAGLSAGTGPTQGRVLVWVTDAERGLGGDSLGGALIGERQWDRTARLVLGGTTTAGRVRLDATAGADGSRLRWAAPYPAFARPDAVDDTGHTRSLHTDLRATVEAAGWTWTALTAVSRASATHPSLSDRAADASGALAASGAGRLGPLHLFPSLRLDGYAPAGRDRQLALSPHLGLNAALTPALRLKASLGRAFRMPTLNDRFWSPGGRPDLRPERALAADAGLAWTRGGWSAEATAFVRTARDEIVWVPGANGIWVPENVTRSRALGAEVSGAGRHLLRLGSRPVLAEVGSTATLLRARDLTTDRPLRYQPAWTARVWTGLDLGAVRLDLGLRGVGERPTTTSGSLPLPAYAVADATLRADRRVAGALVTLGLAAENLLDARYESVRLHPMPPRHVRLRLAVSTR